MIFDVIAYLHPATLVFVVTRQDKPCTVVRSQSNRVNNCLPAVLSIQEYTVTR